MIMAQPKPKTVTRYLPAGMNINPQNKDELFEPRQDPSSKKKTQKKKKKITETNVESFIMDDDFLEYTRQQHSISTNSPQLNSRLSEEFLASCLNRPSSQVVNDTPQNKCTPPKTICKNKSIVLDLDLQGNTNSIFGVDVKSIKISSIPAKPEEAETEQPDVSFENAPFASNPAGITFKDKLLQTLNKNLQQNRSSNEISYPQDGNKCSSSKNVSSPPKIEGSVPSCKTDKLLSKDITRNKDPNFVKQLTQQNDMVEKEGWYEDNIIFSDGNSESVVKRSVPLLRNSDLTNSAEIIRETSKKIIIHGVIIPKPVHSLEEASFTNIVLEALQARGFTSPTELQSFMWPAIQRGFNVFMVAPSQSGKKFAYLPALITFTVGLSDNYKGLKKYKGPLIVIMCTDNNKCKEVINVIYNLVQNSSEVVRLGTASDISSLETCDVLVATLSDLVKLLQSGKITLKRLCHLVLDQANVLLKSDAHSVSKFLKMVNEMQKNRPHNKNIQVIVSSEKWTADLDVLMRKLYLPPVVCLMDFLEATLYSNIDFKKKKLNSGAHKKFLLEDILKHKYQLHKSIVFCDENEIPELKEYLVCKGIECISISNDLIEDEIFENEDMWCSLKIGQFKVLLCTDKLFRKTGHIVNANWLIHYSLPPNWETFQDRFKCFVENIKYPLTIDNSDTYEENRSYIFIVGDSVQANVFNDFFNGLIAAKVRYLKL